MAEFYRVVRVLNNGNENIIRDVPWTSFTEEQSVRAQSFADGTARSLQGQRIRIYSSDENGVVAPGDLIWDSAVNL